MAVRVQRLAFPHIEIDNNEYLVNRESRRSGPVEVIPGNQIPTHLVKNRNLPGLLAQDRYHAAR